MDLLIVDFDCQPLMADQIKGKELQGLSEEQEVTCLNEADWEANHWQIPDGRWDKVNRYVFLTCFSGGIKKYHRDLFTNNPQCLSWIIAVLDVEHESYKKQLLAQIDQAFYISDAYYDVVFDSAETLQETRRMCQMPAKMQKKCLVVSKNTALAEKARTIMEGYLPSWETVSAIVTSQEAYRFADAVLVVGEKEEELAVPAPAVGLNRRYVWLNRRFVARGEYAELAEMARDRMNGCGWNIADYRNRLYVSDIAYEAFYQEIQNGGIEYSTLREREDFVMWDAYGLPVTGNAYTQGRIADFLKENCCFEKIKERMMARHESRRRI